MNDESIEHLERQMAGLSCVDLPPTLRASVLADVQRELRADRWDRRLARAAVVLLAVGVGLNMVAELESTDGAGSRSPIAVQTNPRQSLVDTAVVVAEATDARTGRQYARQLAVMTGHTLTVDEAAAIDAAVGHTARDASDGKKG